MIITYQQEPPGRSIAEALPLFKLHYAEIARYLDIPLDPDLGMYETVEAAGNLRVYSARHEGELVGYVIFFLRTHPHYKTSLHAHQDVLFLLPAYRKGLVGIRLIKFADKMLGEEGVQVVSHHVKDYADFGPILERMGYEKVETIYMRRLDV